MKPRTGYNPKREIAPLGNRSPETLTAMAARARYGGNPEHKRTPGDYGLTPPTNPRPRKTLCDAQGPFLKAEALSLVQEGIRKGLVSVRQKGEWPQNVWALSKSGDVFEAQLENAELGVYHGYPMPLADAFLKVVQKEWKRR